MPLKNVREKKAQLRAKHKRFRITCPKEIKAELDKKLSDALLESDEYKSCKTLFCFVSSPIEVDTSKILTSALDDGKRLALPRCKNRHGDMDFYYVNDLSSLIKGEFSIYEPNPELCEQVTDFSSGLCIVPGLSFDLQGYRLGFGKGYYDRFLQKFGGVTVGLCYSKCVEHSLPTGSFDKPVDILITEKYISNHTHNLFAKE